MLTADPHRDAFSSGEPSFVVLHLTDFHFGQDIPQIRWAVVLEAFLSDLAYMARSAGVIDAIAITGDIANRGAPADFSLATDQLGQLVASVSTLQDTPPAVLVVPGNHDLTRAEEDALAILSLAAPEDFDKAVNRALKSEGSRLLSPILSAFSAFSHWRETCDLLTPPTVTGKIPGDACYIVDGHRGLRVAFLGLNTAYSQLRGGDYEGHLSVCEAQVDAMFSAISTLDAVPENVVLLSHHPLSWLRSAARTTVRELVVNGPLHPIAHLFGHRHERNLSAPTADGVNHTLDVQTSSFFGLEQYGDGQNRLHGYSVVVFAERDGVVTGRLGPRRASEIHEGTWVFDRDNSAGLSLIKGNDFTAPIRLRTVRAEGGTASRNPVSARLVRAHAPHPGPPTDQDHVWSTLGQIETVLLTAAPPRSQPTVWDDPRSGPERGPLTLIEQLLSGTARLTNAEVLFVGAATLLTAGLRRLAAERMPSFQDWVTASNWAREVASISTSHDRLFARALGRRGVPADYIGTWLQSAAIARSDAPWRMPETVAIATKVASVLETRSGDIETIADALLRVSRHAAFGRVGQGSTTSRLLAGGLYPGTGSVELVRASHVEPVAIAVAAMIFNPGLDGQELVEQVGLAPDFNLEQAMHEVWGAEWAHTPTNAPALVCRCSDPAVELSLVAMCDRLRARGDHLGEGVGAQAVRDELLARVRTDTVLPRVQDGLNAYESPVPRLTMNTERVRELLMGEQLYGDPRLALREVYQNALDACRYRQKREAFLANEARVPWEGAISFTLIDMADGASAVLECIDNGVGMDKQKITGSFLRAGERFIESPDFVEEQLRWRERDPGVSLVPNSTFGIGAYSYFMIADRVEVFSRPQDEEGSVGELVYLNLVAGSTIARVRILEEDSTTLSEGGTLVRFHLRSQYASGARLTLREFLDDTVWVSPFELTVTERGESVTRAARTLSSSAPPWQAVAYDDGDSMVWWSVRDSRLLADGISTPEELVGVTANLHGAHKPILRVDRNAVVSWDKEWLLETLATRGASLVEWEDLNLAWLWRLGEAYPVLANELTKVLVVERPTIPLGLSRAWSQIVDLRQVGCFPADRYLLPQLHELARHKTAYPDIPLPSAKVFRERHFGPNVRFPDGLRPWRRAVWQAAVPGLFEDWKPQVWGLQYARRRPVAEPNRVDVEASPDPIDAALLASQPAMSDFFGDHDHGLLGHVDLTALTFGAYRCGIPLGEALARLARFSVCGLRGIPTLAAGSEDYVPSADDAIVMSTLDPTFAHRAAVTKGDLLELLPLCQEARLTLDDGIHAARQILERFGVRVPRMAALDDGLGDHVPTQREVDFFGFSWTKHGYELRDSEATRSMVLGAARRAAIYNDDAVRRLLRQYAPFGVGPLARRFRYPNLSRFSEQQRVAWSENFDGRPSWIDEDVYGRGYMSAQPPSAEEVAGHAVFYSALTGVGLRESLATVFEFPGLTVSPPFELDSIDNRPVDEVDLKVLRRRIGSLRRSRSERFEGMIQSSIIRRQLTPYEAVLAAQDADISLRDVFARLERFRFLGTAAPKCDPDTIASRELSPIELKIVTSKDPRFASDDRRHRFPDDEPEPIEGPIPGLHLFLTARSERMSLGATWAVMEGLQAVGFESSVGAPPKDLTDYVPSELDANLADGLDLEKLGTSMLRVAQREERSVGELCAAARRWGPWVYGLEDDAVVDARLEHLSAALGSLVPRYADCVLAYALRHDIDQEGLVARLVEVAAEMRVSLAQAASAAEQLLPVLDADGIIVDQIPRGISAIDETPSWEWLLLLGLAGPTPGAMRRLARVLRQRSSVVLNAATIPTELRRHVTGGASARTPSS